MRFRPLYRVPLLPPVLLLVLFAAGACSGAPAGPTATLGHPVDVRVGQTVVVIGEGLTIAFDRVVSDSRCPTGVTCVWEGDGVVEIRAQQTGRAAERLELHTHAGFAQEAAYAEYRVRLEGLAPHPDSSRTTRPEEVVATILVTKP